MKVYLDYAATGPVKKEILAAMMPFLTSDFSAQGGPAYGWGNPSSIHEWGRVARSAVDESRETVANFLNCEAQEIIFTSGGTESDNLAITGVIAQISKPEFLISNQFQNSNLKIKELNKNLKLKIENCSPHIITSMIEHHAVLNTCKDLEKKGVAEVTYIKPNCDGVIEIDDVKRAIRPNTILISIMYVNNEIGTIQPIREIGKMIENENKSRKQSAVSCQPIFFHTDAVQATEYQNMDVNYLHVDLLTISGHKIGAPKGIGALYVKKGTPLEPQMHGGEQENGKRAGTENVAGIVAIAKACEIIQKPKSEVLSLTANLRDYFIDRVIAEIPDTKLNGSKEFRSPNNVNIYFKYVEGESILLNLDLVGIAASTGSACASVSLESSHVIKAVYNDAERAHGSIRFTLGEATTKKEIDYTIEKLKIIIEKLRAISPLRQNNQ